ncbi:MAG: hypothetical protein K2P90_04205, partial [Holosporales bacterium]|nr:hypothetical protein [Holosporales bacterium]
FWPPPLRQIKKDIKCLNKGGTHPFGHFQAQFSAQDLEGRVKRGALKIYLKFSKESGRRFQEGECPSSWKLFKKY